MTVHELLKIISYDFDLFPDDAASFFNEALMVEVCKYIA